jgi:hypothetical protein
MVSNSGSDQHEYLDSWAKRGQPAALHKWHGRHRTDLEISDPNGRCGFCRERISITIIIVILATYYI